MTPAYIKETMYRCQAGHTDFRAGLQDSPIICKKPGSNGKKCNLPMWEDSDLTERLRGLSKAGS